MPQATRQGDMSTGHDLCTPKSLTSGSETVFINGKLAGRQGDVYEVHNCAEHPPHQDSISEGSSTVFINGMPAARVGDGISIGGNVASGSDNVFVGG